jgi:hypothetical protein
MQIRQSVTQPVALLLGGGLLNLKHSVYRYRIFICIIFQQMESQNYGVLLKVHV